MPTTYLALLRGINLGPKNKIAMADLSQVFSEAGCSDVRTYIQSGNVIFTAAPELSARLPDLITAQIQKRFGHKEQPRILSMLCSWRICQGLVPRTASIPTGRRLIGSLFAEKRFICYFLRVLRGTSSPVHTLTQSSRPLARSELGER
jgi:hypothetical protein